MTIHQQANDDFERAVARAFLRKILTRLTGESNELLPFDEVRDRLVIRGQHYAGLQQVPIDQIVGSMGRYKDFDRAFLPTQSRTKARWVSIDKAHYEEVPLPPVDLYKIGEIFFVQDGNHRVSVARERGQEFVDAYVTEIHIPVVLTPDIKVDDLILKQEHAEFLMQTGLNELRPGAQVEPGIPGLYKKLLEHIDVHRWYLGVQRGIEVSYSEAVASWYDHVYRPLVEVIREQRLLRTFPGYQEADLYLWIVEYQGYLRQAYQAEDGSDETAKAEAVKQFAVNYPQPALLELTTFLNRAAWLDDIILDQERAAFYEQTQLEKVRQEARVEVTLPGQYDKLREHIAVHRWYLGEQRKAEVPEAEAVGSWYDHVYCPLVEIIREHGILKDFPGRTETDLYLWIIKHQWRLQEAYGDEVPMAQAAVRFAEDYSQRPVKRMFKALKRVKRRNKRD